MAGRGRGTALLEILRSSGTIARPGNQQPQLEQTLDTTQAKHGLAEKSPSVQEEHGLGQSDMTSTSPIAGSQREASAKPHSTLEEAIKSANERISRAEPDEMAACLQNWNPMEEDFNCPTFNSYDSGPGKDLPLQSQRPVQGDQQTSTNYQLYVTGIPLEMTEIGLSNLFSRAGHVMRTKKLPSKIQGRPDTYGFVQFRLLSEVESAIRMLDNYPIGQCMLRVRIALSPEERDARRKQKELQYKLADEVGGEEEEELAPQTVNEDGEEVTEPTEGTPKDTEPSVHNVPRSDPAQSVTTSTHPNPPNASAVSESTHYAGIPARHVTPSATGERPKHTVPNDQSAEATKTATARKTPTIKPEPRPCLFCGMEAYKRCTKCQGAYCDAKCQTEDWMKHKLLCKKPVSEFEARFEIDDDEIDDCLEETIANQRVDVSSLQTETLSIGKPTEVILTDCVSPDNFSLVKAANWMKLEDLKKNMNETFSNHKPQADYSPEVGEVCAAPYLGDWYRAVVEQLHGARGEAVVTFVDYGNRETVGLGHLAKLPPTMAGLPLQAMQCSLSVQPVSEDGEWSAQSLQVLAVKLSPAEGSLVATNLGQRQQKTSVALTKDGDDLAEYLISEEVARKYQTPKDVERASQTVAGHQSVTPNLTPQNTPHPPAQAPNPTRTSPSPVSPYNTPPVVEPMGPSQPVGVCKATSAQQVEYIHKQAVVLGEQLTVQVVHIETVDKFWIQVDNTEEFEELQERLRAVYHNKAAKTGFSSFARGTGCPKHMLVAAYSPTYQTWFRGKVVDYDTSKVSVYYLDYGNQEKVDFSHVHSLDSSFCSLPAQALCCKLEGVHSKSQVALACFHSYVENVRLEAKVCSEEDGLYVVDLYDPNKEASVKDTLLCQFTPPRSKSHSQQSNQRQPSPKQPSPQSHTQSSPRPLNTKEPSPKKQSPKRASPKAPSPKMPSSSQRSIPEAISEPQLVLAASLPPSTLPTSADLHSVMVHEATSVDNVILYDVDKLDEYDTFLAQVDDLLDGYSGQYEPSTPGELVLVRDMGSVWLRGEVLCVGPGSKALLRLVDTNRIEDADFSDIAPMSSELKQPPVMSIRCALWNVKSVSPGADWVRDIKPELCCTKPMKATVIRFGVPCHIELYVEPDFSESLNSVLIRKGYVIPRVPLTTEDPITTTQPSDETPEKVLPVSRTHTPPAPVMAGHPVTTTRSSDKTPEKVLPVSCTHTPPAPVMAGHPVTTTRSSDKTPEKVLPVSRTHTPPAPVMAGHPVTTTRSSDKTPEKVLPVSRTHTPPAPLMADHPITTTQSNDNTPEKALLVPSSVLPVHTVEVDHRTRHTIPSSLKDFSFSEGETQQFRSPAPCVTICHVDDPGSFFCHWNDEGIPQAFEEEEEAFRQTLKRLRPKHGEHTLQVRDKVAVLSPTNNMWYRAEVRDKDFRGTGKVLVFLVDYGSKDLVADECIRPLPADHTRFPYQAIHCGLVSWDPNKCVDTAAAIAAAKELLEGRMVSLVLDGFREERYRVLDIREHNTSTSQVRQGGVLYDVLKEKSTGKEEVPPKLPDADGDGPMPAQFPCHQQGTMPSQLIDPRQVTMPAQFTGHITFINSISDFYVQELSCEQDSFQESVNHHCQRSSPPNPFRSKKGRLCGARFSVDQQWYRARVVDTEPDGRLNVFFIDYGNTERVESSETRPLPDHLVSVPAKAFRCGLSDLTEPDTKWKPAENQRFAELVSSSALEVVSRRQEGDVHLVTLTHPAQGDVGRLLMEEGIRASSTTKPEVSLEEMLKLKKENEDMKRRIAALTNMLESS